MSWRHIPAEIIVELIRGECGHFPPTLEELNALAARYNYRVLVCPSDTVPCALTDHTARLIDLPATRPEVMRAMLLHEIAEALLRLPVAPEFHFRPSDLDDFHEVARIVEQRR